MNLPSYSLNTKSKLNTYIEKEILEANPKQLLIKIYDNAIVNCQRKDIAKTNRAIQELINSLNFEDESAKGISIGLLKLYLFCQEQMRSRNYEIVYKILRELRQTWIDVFNSAN
ncbi:flagellar protein FliS [Melioribacteraceae bacterium 4301-Me]|uniref:flagellar protein FliS n=1 Tax=Pyranulibacter aquaticus TaxID=3163344 RepID=UPI00359A746A